MRTNLLRGSEEEALRDDRQAWELTSSMQKAPQSMVDMHGRVDRACAMSHGAHVRVRMRSRSIIRWHCRFTTRNVGTDDHRQAIAVCAASHA